MNDINESNIHSTGPRTESGKARSSQNATKYGLFSAHDFILEGEKERYEKDLSALWDDLQPAGVLEVTFTQEIMSANWRLRRCRIVEAAISARELAPEDLAAEQRSLNRARAHSHAILRRSLAELRKLQTERAIRMELGGNHYPGLADSRQIIQTVKTCEQHRAWQENADRKAEKHTTNPDAIIDNMDSADAALGMQTPFESSFCNPTRSAPPVTPRNASCPCGSGEKFKRCCGIDAPPVLGRAA